MCVTHADGTPIWQRGGRVKDLSLQVGDGGDAKSALLNTAKNLREGAAEIRKSLDEHREKIEARTKDADEKDKQAEELELAASKL